MHPPHRHASFVHERVRQACKAEEARAAILDLLSGEYRTPGLHLGDEALAKRFGIGRTPTREALIRLAAEEHIIHVRQKGYFTRLLRKARLLEAYDLLKLMLTYAVGRPARRRGVTPVAPDGDLSHDPCTDSSVRAENLFQAVARRSGNDSLAHLVASLSNRTHPVRAEIAAQPDLRDGFDTSLASLEAACRFEDSAAIRKALLRHLTFETRHVETIVRNLNDRAMENLPFLA